MIGISGQGALRVTALSEPVPRGVLVREVEVLHLRVSEMARNVRHDCRECAVRGDRNFLHFLMMILHELKVGKQRAETFPSLETISRVPILRAASHGSPDRHRPGWPAS